MNNLMHFYIPEKKFSTPKKANIPKKFTSNWRILRSNRWLLLLWLWPGKLTNFHQMVHKNTFFEMRIWTKNSVTCFKIQIMMRCIKNGCPLSAPPMAFLYYPQQSGNNVRKWWLTSAFTKKKIEKLWWKLKK